MADNSVFTLAFSGTTVYAGGDFTIIGGQFRNHIAALDINTGVATTWNPNADARVMTLVLGDTTLYAGGGFTGIGGQSRNYIAALDAGSATAWNPNADRTISTLLFEGRMLYAGGDFHTIGEHHGRGVTGFVVPVFNYLPLVIKNSG